MAKSINQFFLWMFNWPKWISYVTAIWSLLYGFIGLYWWVGGAGFPFGEGDPNAKASILYGLEKETGSSIIAILGLVGGVAAFLMGRKCNNKWLRWPLLLFGFIVFIVLALLIPDARVMIAVAYLPIVIVGYPFNFPPVSYMIAIPWPVINQFILIVGGLLWLATSIVYFRESKKACGYCGRISGKSFSLFAPNNAAKWGKWALYISLLTPIYYATSRIAWALGIPLGVSEQFLQELHANDLWLAGLGLAMVSIIGAILSLGLNNRWGEVFPRWIPYFSNKTVPPIFVVVSSMLIAVFMISCGFQVIRQIMDTEFHFHDLLSNPMVFFPLWGPTLAVATIGYYYRRRGSCKYCRQSD
jgi:hypothetical protein